MHADRLWHGFDRLDQLTPGLNVAAPFQEVAVWGAPIRRVAVEFKMIVRVDEPWKGNRVRESSPVPVDELQQ